MRCLADRTREHTTLPSGLSHSRKALIRPCHRRGAYHRLQSVGWLDWVARRKAGWAKPGPLPPSGAVSRFSRLAGVATTRERKTPRRHGSVLVPGGLESATGAGDAGVYFFFANDRRRLVPTSPAAHHLFWAPCELLSWPESPISRPFLVPVYQAPSGCRKHAGSGGWGSLVGRGNHEGGGLISFVVLIVSCSEPRSLCHPAGR